MNLDDKVILYKRGNLTPSTPKVRLLGHQKRWKKISKLKSAKVGIVLIYTATVSFLGN